MVKGTAHATKLGFGPSVSHLLQAFSSCSQYILSYETDPRNEIFPGAVLRLKIGSEE